ncbi:MAG: N-acetylmuramyl-L-alanine amidase, negative regulator of AmpC, AmpD [Clostridia bacterium]|jgi:N-acetylmuramoyl-L-alanine amidase CwlA|nr:N-acetylmuramyl-L-alanine amidase, negative regulator of AmpC, AmpD [Clostridia bacterium]
MYIEEKLLSVNPMSRPGIKLKQIKKLIVHYVNNPSSNAILNRNYFESLKYQDKIYLSAHYIIGLEGDIIRIIPEDEVAFHSGNKEVNRISIGIENTYLDDTGKFNTYTYNSLVELLSYLSNKYNLDPTQDIIRHYDVTGKNCPKYYVEYPLEFEKLKNDVKNKNA